LSTSSTEGIPPRMTTLSDQEFRMKSDEALEDARRMLLPLADTEGFEVELQNGVLDLVFEEPSAAKFVVSPNAPVRQIWVSAMSRSYKLPWSADAGAFALDGEPLSVLLTRLAHTFLHG
jgi:frataxin-like iron-binding protein CyaY